MDNKDNGFSKLKSDDNLQIDNKSLSIKSDSVRQNNICEDKKKGSIK